MSGIVGLARWDDQAVTPEALAAMLTSLAHRGPNGAASWREGQVGLGHLALHTTPESLFERQPLLGPGATFALSADIRLDNRAELYQQLGPPRQALAELTDPDLVLLAYQRWGANCPDKLLGDFAFALWDKAQQSLFCARDHMGVKPFYYHDSPRRFAFGSEIKALLSLPDMPREVNEQRVAAFLCLLDSADKDDTFYRGVKRLPPGHTLTRNSSGLSLQRYWRPDPQREIHLRSDVEYAEAFRELFMAATTARLRSATPVAAILSGGLDSACVTSAARQLWTGAPPLHALSAFFTGPGDTDERPFIDAVLADGGFAAQRIDGNDLNITRAEVKTITQQLEEPIWYVFQFVLWRLYALAQQAGARVLLDGVDGDSLLAGCRYQYIPGLLRSGHWPSFWAECAAQAHNSPGAAPALFSKRMFGALWRNSGDALLGAPWRVARARARPTKRVRVALLKPQVAGDPYLQARLRDTNDVINNGWSSVRAVHFIRLTDGAFPYHLEMLDRAAAYFGLEYRHPFFDKRLVEFCLALPPNQRLYHGATRVIMRRALKDILPEVVYQRPGKGVVTHRYQYNILGSGEPPLVEIARQNVPEMANYVDSVAWSQALQAYLATNGASQINGVWHSTSVALWLLYMMKQPQAAA